MILEGCWMKKEVEEGTAQKERDESHCKGPFMDAFMDVCVHSLGLATSTVHQK